MLYNIVRYQYYTTYNITCQYLLKKDIFTFLLTFHYTSAILSYLFISLENYPQGFRFFTRYSLHFISISLDIFNKMHHNKLTELEAWLCFLSSDDPADILHLIQEFPFFREYYNEIIQFRYHPKELITMFSDALRIMDENAVKYMVDEMKAEISRQKAEISDQNAKISNQETEIARLRAELARYQK